jgi:hypothetical protein
VSDAEDAPDAEDALQARPRIYDRKHVAIDGRAAGDAAVPRVPPPHLPTPEARLAAAALRERAMSGLSESPGRSAVCELRGVSGSRSDARGAAVLGSL